MYLPSQILSATKRVRKEVYLERQKKDSAAKVRTKPKEIKKSKAGLKAK